MVSSVDVFETNLSYKYLKAKHRKGRNQIPENLSVRVHRGLSWLKRAEMEVADDDAAFIFYWIAFNASYAEVEPGGPPKNVRNSFEKYFKKLIDLDIDQRVYTAIWERFSGPIRIILNNQYVFGPYWNFQNQIPGYADWEEQFKRSLGRVKFALKNKETEIVLSILFDRLYVLRNQLIHGAATWGGKVNRDQVRDGAKILAFLVPLLVDLMLDNPETVWGQYHYPVME